MKEKSAATLSIFRAPEMTPAGRKRIAAWLRRQADMLVEHGEQYTENRFTARYIYGNRATR